MTRITPALACALLVAAHGTALAQNDAVSFEPFDTLARDLRSAQGTRAERARDYADFLRGDAQDLALYALGTQVYTALVEEGRIDKQLGASSAGPGSTSLVSRGSVPRETMREPQRVTGVTEHPRRARRLGNRQRLNGSRLGRAHVANFGKGPNQPWSLEHPRGPARNLGALRE